MARVNMTLPDDRLSQSKPVGLKVARLALAALAKELDRRTERNLLADDNCARTRLLVCSVGLAGGASRAGRRMRHEYRHRSGFPQPSRH